MRQKSGRVNLGSIVICQRCKLSFEVGDTRFPYWTPLRPGLKQHSQLNDALYLQKCPICGGKTNGSAN